MIVLPRAQSTLSFAALLCLLVHVSSPQLHGDFVAHDSLFDAVDKAMRGLSNGCPRQQVLDQLTEAQKKVPESIFQDLAQRLATDLDRSIHEPPSRLPGVQAPLMDTTAELSLFEADNKNAQAEFMKQNPLDPATYLFGADRQLIDKLIPMLSDLSPTRPNDDGFRQSDQLPGVARVCDFAYCTIESLSHCRFYSKADSEATFHNLSIEDRTKIIWRINKWWKSNKNKSVADGIRAQIPYADDSSKTWMAGQLGEIKEGNHLANRADAIEILKSLISKYKGYIPNDIALALGRLGDLSPMQYYRQRCIGALENPPQTIESDMATYMLSHASSEDWELLCKLARREIAEGKNSNAARVWPVLVSCPEAKTSPFAIPGLALALSQSSTAGSRPISNTGTQSYTYADLAAEQLQKLTGEDFGYRPEGTEAERNTAIAKAHDWWTSVGDKKYNFSYLEKLAELRRMQAEKAPASTKD